MTKCSPGDGPGLPPLVAVLGATACGKSELALRIARDCGGEIINFDSVQVYRRFDIGSAKLLSSARADIPHHLIDVVEPAELFTAGDFVRSARTVLRDMLGRNRVPVLVGGTGFYLRSLLEGLSPAPERDQALRARLEKREDNRSGSLHRILSRLDPKASARIHPNDRRKLVRALELCLLRRRPASSLTAGQRDALTGFRTLKLGLNVPRPVLNARIDGRVTQMFEHGLIEEVQSILASGVPRTAKPFESLGYAQALGYLDGKFTLAEAIGLAQQGTRQYAKRQMTWFRRELDVHWFQNFGEDPAVQAEALALIRAGL